MMYDVCINVHIYIYIYSSAYSYNNIQVSSNYDAIYVRNNANTIYIVGCRKSHYLSFQSRMRSTITTSVRHNNTPPITKGVYQW